MRTPLIVSALAVTVFSGGHLEARDTFESVVERGTLRCGAHVNRAGFASRDANDNWHGFDVGICRAIAAVILNDPGAHVILSEVVSREPLGLVVRSGDDHWASIVRWTLFALIAAEELGVTSTNLEEVRNSTSNPEIRRLLGREGQFGTEIGLDDDWAARAISAVGNYGELFSSTIGDQTPIGLARGLNAQWTQGGLLYAPPFR